MAMFHLSTKTISRKLGRTATASAAYRAGEKIHCERTGETHDYTRKSGVMASSAFLFDGDKKIVLDRQDLWNVAEKSEKRKDARTAREIVVNLPHELTPDQRQHLVDDFTKSLAKGLGVAIDYAIHEPNRKGDDRNYHAHIMMTTRTASLENGALVLGAKSNIELENKALKAKGLPSTQAQITDIRKDWADYTNHHLRKAGLDITIDHRSHKERGLEIAPTIKLGVAVTAMERRGIETDKGNFNRAIKRANGELQDLLDIVNDNGFDFDAYELQAPSPYKPKPKPAEPAPEPAPPPPPPAQHEINNIRDGWHEYTAEHALHNAFSPRYKGNPLANEMRELELKKQCGMAQDEYEKQKKLLDAVATANASRLNNNRHKYSDGEYQQRIKTASILTDAPAPAPEPKPEPAKSRDDFGLEL